MVLGFAVNHTSAPNGELLTLRTTISEESVVILLNFKKYLTVISLFFPQSLNNKGEQKPVFTRTCDVPVFDLG